MLNYGVVNIWLQTVSQNRKDSTHLFFSHVWVPKTFENDTPLETDISGWCQPTYHTRPHSSFANMLILIDIKQKSNL